MAFAFNIALNINQMFRKLKRDGLKETHILLIKSTQQGVSGLRAHPVLRVSHCTQDGTINNDTIFLKVSYNVSNISY